MSLGNMPDHVLQRILGNHATRVRAGASSSVMHAAMRNTGLVAGGSNPLLSASNLAAPSATPRQTDVSRCVAGLQDMHAALCKVLREYSSQSARPPLCRDRYAFVRGLFREAAPRHMQVRFKYGTDEAGGRRTRHLARVNPAYAMHNNAHEPHIKVTMRLMSGVYVTLFMYTRHKLILSAIKVRLPHTELGADDLYLSRRACNPYRIWSELTWDLHLSHTLPEGVRGLRLILHDMQLLQTALNTAFIAPLRLSISNMHAPAGVRVPSQLKSALNLAGLNTHWIPA